MVRNIGTWSHYIRMTCSSKMVLVVKNPPASAGDAIDTDSIPGSGRCPGGGDGTTLQYLCLENSMGSGAWWAAVHVAAKSYTQLSTHTRIRLIFYKHTRCKKSRRFFLFL